MSARTKLLTWSKQLWGTDQFLHSPTRMSRLGMRDIYAPCLGAGKVKCKTHAMLTSLRGSVAYHSTNRLGEKGLSDGFGLQAQGGTYAWQTRNRRRAGWRKRRPAPAHGVEWNGFQTQAHVCAMPDLRAYAAGSAF